MGCPNVFSTFNIFLFLFLTRCAIKWNRNELEITRWLGKSAHSVRPSNSYDAAHCPISFNWAVRLGKGGHRSCQWSKKPRLLGNSAHTSINSPWCCPPEPWHGLFQMCDRTRPRVSGGLAPAWLQSQRFFGAFFYFQYFFVPVFDSMCSKMKSKWARNHQVAGKKCTQCTPINSLRRFPVSD